MAAIARVWIVVWVLIVLFPLGVLAAAGSEPEELAKVIAKINDRQTKNLKQFEKKTKAYFFDTQSPETVEGLIKEFSPGDTVTTLIFANLSKKPVKEIMAIKKAGATWPDIAGKLKISLKAAVKDVKDFRSGIG